VVGDVLYERGELNYYVRHVEYPNGGNFVPFITRVMQFYDRRVDIQANIEKMEKERT